MRKILLLVLLAAATSCFGQGSAPLIPRIVARVTLTGQTTVIPTTTIFTPNVNGLYRISVYGAMTTPVSENAASWYVSFGWNDEAGAESVETMDIPDWAAPPAAFGYCLVGALTSEEQSPAGCQLVVRNVAGKPLTYSGGSYNNPGGTYELFITVEQLM